jgi:DNA-binding response OmpR family regulator
MSEKLRILVVEDNPADADFIHEMLPESGTVSFHIESVSRLSEALTRMETKDIDLVLLDLGLPDSQGLQTFHEVRKGAPDIPVIVLTGTDDHELGVAAVREGAQDYLVKGQVGGSLLARAARYALERQKAAATLRKQTEELRARNNELTRFNRIAVGRELRMIELKHEVNELCHRLGEPPRHAMDLPPDDGVLNAGPDPAVAAGILPAVSGGFQPPGPKPDERV